MKSRKKIRSTLLLFLDVILINLAYLFSFYVKYDLNMHTKFVDMYLDKAIIITLIYIVPMILLNMYRSLWKDAGFDEFIRTGIAIFIGFIFNLIYMNFTDSRVPMVLTILASILIFVLLVGVRLSYRILRRVIIYKSIFLNKNNIDVLVIGAGECGKLVIDEMRKDSESNLKAVAIIDDDKNKANTYLRGIKIFGGREKIKEVVLKNNIDLILIAISKIDAKNKKEIIEICNKTKVKVKIIPGMHEIINGDISLTKMRDVDLKDLLGRDEIVLDKQGISNYVQDKVVLVTGGGGSIGSELCRQIAKFKPKQLVILDIYENNAYEIQNELKMKYPELNQVAIIASVRERWRMNEVFDEYKPEVVFHAAAHKHVPLMETSPIEAIKNNLKGTYNTATLAYEHGVKRFVLISTDKAVNPTNVMGATKRFCEMIIQAMQTKARKENKKSEFVAVRFGNVLGSNGSVIPLFKKQISEGGPVTLTHKEITRYFMLIPEAAQLVLQAGAYAKGGEIFILDMGSSVKIYDLAENLIRLSGFKPGKDIEIKITGLRPGEKLYEELLMDEEGLTQTENEKIFVGKPGEFDIDILKENIYELIRVGEEECDESLREKLHEFVPTYARSTEELIAITKQ